MRISDWSSDVCSSDLLGFVHLPNLPLMLNAVFSLSGTDHYVLAGRLLVCLAWVGAAAALGLIAWQKTKSPAVAATAIILLMTNTLLLGPAGMLVTNNLLPITVRSEEHTSELQSLMRISYAVFCL